MVEFWAHEDSFYLQPYSCSIENEKKEAGLVFTAPVIYGLFFCTPIISKKVPKMGSDFSNRSVQSKCAIDCPIRFSLRHFPGKIGSSSSMGRMDDLIQYVVRWYSSAGSKRATNFCVLSFSLRWDMLRHLTIRVCRFRLSWESQSLWDSCWLVDRFPALVRLSECSPLGTLRDQNDCE